MQPLFRFVAGKDIRQHEAMEAWTNIDINRSDASFGRRLRKQ